MIWLNYAELRFLRDGTPNYMVKCDEYIPDHEQSYGLADRLWCQMQVPTSAYDIGGMDQIWEPVQGYPKIATMQEL